MQDGVSLVWLQHMAALLVRPNLAIALANLQLRIKLLPGSTVNTQNSCSFNKTFSYKSTISPTHKSSPSLNLHVFFLKPSLNQAMARTGYLGNLMDESENDEYDFNKEEDFDEETQPSLGVEALLQAFART
jgi:hypothetical protein